MISNRKAQGFWTVALIYVFYFTILLTMTISTALVMSAATSRVSGWHTDYLEFNLIGARLLNSADCLALREDFGTGQVRLGIIDVNKVTQDRIQKCISDVDFKVEIKDISSDPWSIPTISLGPTPVDNDQYFVKLYNNGEYHDGVMTLWLDYDFEVNKR